MRIALVSDTFPPQCSSGAVQIRDLAREFARQGHFVCVLLPSCNLTSPWQLEIFEGFQVLRLKAPQMKDVGYVRRALAELAMPFAMIRNFGKSPLASERWDGVVWYSPSIFHGPFISVLKRKGGCKSYLIVRDIFPQWAVDMELMGRGGLAYRFFDRVAWYQYSLADFIGVQVPSNRSYFDEWHGLRGRRLEVLHNWLDKPAVARCSIQVDQTVLAGRKVFVYAGNMGIAQGMNTILDLADAARSRPDVGFLFVGRGSDAVRLRKEAESRQLDNVVFFGEIHPDEIPALYAQCDAGIVSLDPRHKSHNIPGKFLTYMRSGLPVLANINSGNDLGEIIRNERVGQVSENNQVGELMRLLESLLAQIESDAGLPERCIALFEREFSVSNTVHQIVTGLSSSRAFPTG